ncbi:hypothetical protein F0U59_21310 [Archangium gephyra]|nr:hypothetical protein F0U59_21310 [Archangium gephyra]
MGHSASLDVSYHPGNLYPSTLIRALLSQGWRANDHGGISHTRAGVDNWESSPLERLDEVLEALDEEWDTGEPVAITLVMEGADTGGIFMFLHENTLSVIANYNRRTLERAGNFTDMSWYIERILPALLSLHQEVESVMAREHA